MHSSPMITSDMLLMKRAAPLLMINPVGWNVCSSLMFSMTPFDVDAITFTDLLNRKVSYDSCEMWHEVWLAMEGSVLVPYVTFHINVYLEETHQISASGESTTFNVRPRSRSLIVVHPIRIGLSRIRTRPTGRDRPTACIRVLWCVADGYAPEVRPIG